MPKLANLKPREVEQILLKNGFIMNVSKSSHKQYFNPDTKAHTTIPFHSKDIATGTLRSIIRQSQLSIDLFRK
jgi:predicted RNA binding protein YcfA (HicA-like mRNA interferase family)